MKLIAQLNKNSLLILGVLSLFFIAHGASENVSATKVFIFPIEPSMFNWTLKIGNDFSYRASLLNAPDLPKWIDYLYSKRHKTGFLYGVPPSNHKELEIEIIGLNRKTYETRRRVVHLHIENKSEIATHQIYLKVDNLNVDDFFDLYRMSKLLNIFKYKLWKESFFDLYFTFLSSAVSLGARRPLRPTEGEGVVIHLGSTAKFSNTLTELQEEVKPLSKLQSCPRDFKRTTVERIFRDEGFVLDWCSFKLMYDSPSSAKSPEKVVEDSTGELLKEPIWFRPTKEEVARRTYSKEFAITILVPTFVMISVVLLLSFILGFQREDASKQKLVSATNACELPLDNSRSSNPLFAFSPELRNGTSRSRAPRTLLSNGGSRPTPPPYSGTMLTTVVDF